MGESTTPEAALGLGLCDAAALLTPEEQIELAADIERLAAQRTTAASEAGKIILS
jgi:hypothetical protein